MFYFMWKMDERELLSWSSGWLAGLVGCFVLGYNLPAHMDLKVPHFNALFPLFFFFGQYDVSKNGDNPNKQ